MVTSVHSVNLPTVEVIQHKNILFGPVVNENILAELFCDAFG